MKAEGHVDRIVEVYRTRQGWRWRQRDARNGLITSASTQAYARRSQALYNLATETGIRTPKGAFGYRKPSSTHKHRRWL